VTVNWFTLTPFIPARIGAIVSLPDSSPNP
jgi:hypothetical protein